MSHCACYWNTNGCAYRPPVQLSGSYVFQNSQKGKLQYDRSASLFHVWIPVTALKRLVRVAPHLCNRRSCTDICKQTLLAFPELMHGTGMWCSSTCSEKMEKWCRNGTMLESRCQSPNACMRATTQVVLCVVLHLWAKILVPILYSAMLYAWINGVHRCVYYVFKTIIIRPFCNSGSSVSQSSTIPETLKQQWKQYYWRCGAPCFAFWRYNGWGR